MPDRNRQAVKAANDDPSKIAWRRVTVDTLVSPSPAFVYSIVISSDGVGEADSIVYDNNAAVGDNFLELYCADEVQGELGFNPPLFFSKGIYIDIGTNVKSVVIQFLPVRE